jgi:gamma-glutamylcyclotransferase
MSTKSEIMYFAYGSNLSFSQMHKRCPDNIRLNVGRLNGYRWIISSRGYANVVKSDPDYVLGRIYKINKHDEASLDEKEGYNSVPSCYDKEILPIIVDGISCNCFVYVDPVVQEGHPKNEYIDRINAGLVDSRFPDEYVEKYIRNKIPLIKK